MKPEMKEVHATSTIPLMPKPDSTPLASSYDASSAAASTVARPAVGPTPVHRASTPSSLMIDEKQLIMPVYLVRGDIGEMQARYRGGQFIMPVYRLGRSLPASSFDMPSVCSRTWVRVRVRVRVGVGARASVRVRVRVRVSLLPWNLGQPRAALDLAC